MTWFDFLVKIDKARVVKDDFYEDLLGDDLYKNGAYKLNDVLFNEGKNKDIFAYFAALNTITNFDVAKDGAINVFAYESTDWVNIRGLVIPKEWIELHVATGAGGPIYGTDLDFETEPWNRDGDPYVYLTDGSYNSLI